MFTADQYRAKASEYAKLVRTANGPKELREFQGLERSFTELAENAQWMTDNNGKVELAGPGTSLARHSPDGTPSS
jgi:hypothetical protein